MYLKALSLKGFKSFADPTTLEFEPGVTVIVGPNGSGKSNVVDAVAWVLGAQGPRVVRSSKMDDVIFAGTTKRAPLGRAEVTLTIDNSSRSLPVDMAEVTITRTLFRTGESEYSMNGASCRLLDIQELLSDAGVGRQQHVIMGQGQLDSILSARPEERRLVIEEAAGVLKYRRRRERAERRLEATEQNLVRLHDLQREVRRQLRPLERQAEAARRHDALAGELRGLKLYLAGRELLSLRRRLEEAERQHGELEAADSQLRAELARLDDLVAATESALTKEQENDLAGPHADAERLFERATGLKRLIAERQRGVAAALAASTEADVVAALEAEAASLLSQIEETDEAGLALAPEWEAIEADLELLQADEDGFASRFLGTSSESSAADLKAGRAARDAILRRVAGSREALARHLERRASLERQHSDLEGALGASEEKVASLRLQVDGARDDLEAAEEAEREAAEFVSMAETAARVAVERAHALEARRGALQVALDEAHARAGLEHLSSLPGVLGTLLDVVEIDAGCEKAFEAAADDALSAVVVEGRSEARAAIEHLRRSDVQGAVLVAGRSVGAFAGSVGSVESVAGRLSEPLRSRVRASSEGVAGLLDRLLEGVVLCPGDLADALELAGTEAVVVTLQGDRFSSRGWRLGAGREAATRAALESVQVESADAVRFAERARAEAETARRAHAEARGAAAEKARGFEAVAAEHRQLLAQCEDYAAGLGSLADEISRLEEPSRRVETELVALEGELATAESDLARAEDAERCAREQAEAATTVRRELDERARRIAGARTELEVRVAAIAERRQLLAGRRQDIETKLSGYEAEREHARERRRHFERTATVLEALTELVEGVSAELAVLRASLAEARRAHEEAVTAIAVRLRQAREQRLSTEHELEGARERAQRVDLERAELRVRLETATETLRHDLDVEPEEAMAAECPELPPGTPASARARDLERELRLMGPVNPLAMEELTVLMERDQFLSSQLEDVRSSRRELGRVIRAVDEEIIGVFSEAFTDVARHFENLFSTLFPGGTGRLSLVDPTDLLSTGVEIEARPAGRNLRRLSLLSGGERSLVALAFLFAVFRSRPSPFYLMDEVEAALDDVNLHRFLDLVDEFRGEAQLLIVSHQKRTMESADILYGVSMQPGGASKVVSERLHGRDGAGEPEVQSA